MFASREKARNAIRIATADCAPTAEEAQFIIDFLAAAEKVLPGEKECRYERKKRKKQKDIKQRGRVEVYKPASVGSTQIEIPETD